MDLYGEQSRRIRQLEIASYPPHDLDYLCLDRKVSRHSFPFSLQLSSFTTLHRRPGLPPASDHNYLQEPRSTIVLISSLLCGHGLTADECGQDVPE